MSTELLINLVIVLAAGATIVASIATILAHKNPSTRKKLFALLLSLALVLIILVIAKSTTSKELPIRETTTNQSRVDLTLFDFISERNGHQYWVSRAQYNWHEAKQLAEQQGGHLVTISNAAENNVVRNLAVRKNIPIWLGITDEGYEGRWIWVTGEPVTFVDWGIRQPDNQGGSQNWAAMHTDGTGWDDASYVSYYFVLEIE